MLYAPLEFIKGNSSGIDVSVTDMAGDSLKELQELAKQSSVPVPLTEADAVRILWDKHYTDRKGKERFLTILFERMLPVLVQFGYNAETMKKLDMLSEVSDMFLISILVNKWSRNKQVYKMDKTFAKFLIGTEKFVLNRKTLENLVCDMFYLDLEDCDFVGPVSGVFVNIVLTKQSAIVTYFILDKHGVIFSGSLSSDFDENGDLHFDLDRVVPMKHNNPNGLAPSVKELSNFTIKDNSSEIQHRQIVPMILQLLLYMCAKEPDIVENPVTKKTYKKRETVKNKFSEIQMYDVGIIKGSTLRIRLEEMEKESRENTGGGGKAGVSKRPHFRNAHWSHYWTGKGRVNYEVRWIEPIFVGCEAEDVTVIHDIEVTGLPKESSER